MGLWRTAPVPETDLLIAPQRWDPIPLPTKPISFLEGLRTVTTAGDAGSQAGIHHATNIGKQFRPDEPLLPNYKYFPIGYHGRASSVQPSGAPVRRPNGQTKSPEAAEPAVETSRRLDYELELGVWIGPGNALGEPVAIGEAASHIAGYCLLNDWSARDLQVWEYQPLAPSSRRTSSPPSRAGS
jgi:fumarylacetoacetase